MILRGRGKYERAKQRVDSEVKGGVVNSMLKFPTLADSG
jgi:hypothetical protein